MKRAITFALLTTSICIILISCSQTSPPLLQKINEINNLYTEPSDEIISHITNYEIETFDIRGYHISSNDDEELISKNENNTNMSKDLVFNSTISKTNKVVKNPDNPIQVTDESNNTKQFSQAANSSTSQNESQNVLPLWFIVVCTILVPPLGVAMMFGIHDKFWISLALTLCFWIPGLIYSLIQVLN